MNPHLVRILAATLTVCMASVGHAEMASDGQSAVGEVSLVLGRAYLEPESGRRQLLTPGTPVHASDRIVTESNGHVHIRFVDQALVSVRPDSRLYIVEYRFDPADPGQSSIKLNLQEGVTRSISGQGASAARDRFRLNTPIAAIGVRGTDFVVSATRDSVRALVNEGAIVLAPFSSDCTADSFGPCVVNAVELAGNSMQIAEMDGNAGMPQLLAGTLDREPDMMQSEVQAAIADSQGDVEEKTAGTDVVLENVTSRRVQADVAGMTAPRDTPPAPPVVTPVDFTPAQPVTVATVTERQLIWGRWAGGLGDLERITLAYADSRPDRDITVGNSQYVLFRDGNGVTKVQEGLGPISFSLTSAQAFHSSESGSITAMAVNGGTLDINFVNNQFSTQLNLNHSATGDMVFSAAGNLFEGGYFHSRSATERIAGAVSLDGKEAGYFFEKQLESGGIQGLTLWDRNN
ncbi:FecR family protein [Pseudohongiella spirulinae]|uniref:FecR protein domain-containing protein n=1 Tax=Pseudohongiella spirulinae TaxID=1249552 RepID=A0A0S2K9U5_9GAMM|nr:FecR family protein [Pseudohongiella spirulinae]ALO44767.1 hypothetical protein PS2015_69 [Pseudohongiella spirulinae]